MTLIRVDSLVTPNERLSREPIQKASDYSLLSPRSVMIKMQKGTAT